MAGLVCLQTYAQRIKSWFVLCFCSTVFLFENLSLHFNTWKTSTGLLVIVPAITKHTFHIASVESQM